MRTLLLAVAIAAALHPVRNARAQAEAPSRVEPRARQAGLDAALVVGACPAPGSEKAKVDLGIVLWEQRTRTSDDVRRASSEVELTPDAFAEAAGGALDRDHRPLTRALLDEAEQEARQVYGPLKKRFARPRPYDADQRVEPAIAREPSFAFPSGHAVRGMLHALLLAELAPARREALLERGRQIGFDRVRGGVHWPSDVEAGQRLGVALAAARLADRDFRARLEAAREKEWAAGPR